MDKFTKNIVISVAIFIVVLVACYFFNRKKPTKADNGNLGTFSIFSDASEPATIPKRFFAYMPLNHWDTATVINEQINEMVATGANFIAINIKMDDVFSSYADLQANNAANWAKTDQIVNNIKSKNLPVFIRFVTNVSEQYFNISDWWGVANNAKDEWGDSIMANHIMTHPSFSYQTGVDMLKEFVQKGLTRYHNILGSSLYAVGVSTTADYEAGYNYRNEVANGLDVNPHNVMADYSTHSIASFRIWVQNKYGTIANLNTAWGTSFANFGVVQPPKLGTPISQKTSTTLSQLRSMLSGKRGEDWYMFLHGEYKNFVTQVKNITKSFSDKILYVGEYGSNFDELSFLRISHNVPDICRVVDVIKSEFCTRNASNTADSLSADFLRSTATKPIWSEIADFDSGNYQATMNVINSAFGNGADYMAIISSKADTNRWNFSKQAMADMVSNWKNKPVANVSPQNTINVSLSECIHDFPSVKQKWLDAGGGINKRIAVNFTENL